MGLLKCSRRDLLKIVSASTVVSPFRKIFSKDGGVMQNSTTHPEKPDKKNGFNFSDGPESNLFHPVFFQGNIDFASLTHPLISERMVEAKKSAPSGWGIAWGIPFYIGQKIIFLKDSDFTMNVEKFKASWIVYNHTTDMTNLGRKENGFYITPFKGEGYLAEHVADYIVVYADGSEERTNIKRRFHIGMIQSRWGENNILSVTDHKPFPVRAHHEQRAWGWGGSQTRVYTADRRSWLNWLWAWENPHPDKFISGFRFEPKNGPAILSAISAGNVTSNPLRWLSRQKTIFTLPSQAKFDPELDDNGLLKQIQLDLGQVISAIPRSHYPNSTWTKSYNNKVPEVSDNEILVEYTAHPDAHFHLFDDTLIPTKQIKDQSYKQLQPVLAADQKVKLRVKEKESGKPVAVKLHVHGQAGEYLPPVDRHRLPNNAWFEDYSVDFVHQGLHNCSYIPGETQLNLPLGKVYIEISKGFEVKPIRKVVEVTRATDEIMIEIDKVLHWREKGWVTADTHVHFLSTSSALLEGAAEGVNVVNLLASQWGELMTNVGDFDGTTTHGSKEAGGDGEYLVRVGTENRQHVLGHISLLGYNGNIIAPMTTGGPDESAIGDPIEILLTEWARLCKKQDGLVILPHFPNPRLENAACIIDGTIDGVEMTSWGNLYAGISPYSLTDWYRYLNCGYFVAAVGGTDKMSADTAVGTIRTYALIDKESEFTYETWKNAMRRGHTFVTYGPLLEFLVEGKNPGSRIKMSSSGGTVQVVWKVESLTVPMTKVELVVNGESRESQSVNVGKDEGYWSLKIDKSSWLALLVRGHYQDKPEIIAAHSSPVIIDVAGSEFFAAADAITILDQVEGALAYIDTIGTRAEDKIYKRMRMVLESAFRTLHNRMHLAGVFHDHTPATDHKEHH